MPSSSWLEWGRRHRAWILLGLAILFVFAIRVRLRDMPLERDEGEYAYAGQLMLHGVPPYKEAYNMKLPGTYAAYAVIMAVFGQSPAAIHMGLALVNLASIILMFLIARRLLDEPAAAAAAVAFAIMSLTQSVLGLAAHATNFVVLAALGGILLLQQACQTRRLWLYLLAGLLFGVSFLMKQHGIFFGIFGGLYLIGVFISEIIVANSDKQKKRRFTSVPVQPPKFKAQSSKFPASPSLVEARKSEAEAPISPSPIQGSKLSLPPSPTEVQSSDPPPPKYTVPSPTKRKKRRRFKIRGLRSKVPGSKPLLLSIAYKLRSLRSRPQVEVLPPQSWSQFIKSCAIFALGLVVPYALTCLALWFAGAFHEFAFWTISYAGKYVSAMPLANAPELLRRALRAGVGPGLLFWLVPALGAVLMWWDARLRLADRFFLTALTFCSFAAISIGLYFREHYFIMLLPALSLMAGVAVSRAVYLLRHDPTIELFLAIPILGLFVIALGSAILDQGFVWFTMTPLQASRDTYRTMLFAETPKAAAYLVAHTSSQTPIAVVGSEPEIYFYSHRHSATGYIYMYPLLEDHAYALKMQADMAAEIERRKPEYVVFIDDAFDWFANLKYQQSLSSWWNKYWAANLELVMTINVDEGQEKPDRTSPESINPLPQKHILIFKRKPAEEIKKMAGKG